MSFDGELRFTVRVKQSGHVATEPGTASSCNGELACQPHIGTLLLLSLGVSSLLTQPPVIGTTPLTSKPNTYFNDQHSAQLLDPPLNPNTSAIVGIEMHITTHKAKRAPCQLKKPFLLFPFIRT